NKAIADQPSSVLLKQVKLESFLSNKRIWESSYLWVADLKWPQLNSSPHLYSQVGVFGRAPCTPYRVQVDAKEGNLTFELRTKLL
ncbi:hypothetical protein J6590_026831, partial [Homalodisca vitripennis]